MFYYTHRTIAEITAYYYYPMLTVVDIYWIESLIFLHKVKDIP